MFTSILVPLDGSPFAEQALPLAVRLARLGGAALHLVLVHHQVPAVTMAIDVPVFDPEADRQGRAAEVEYLERTAGRIRGAEGIEPVIATLDGAPGEAITQYAVGQGIGLVVMATHGRGPVSRFWLGSVADHLLRHLPMPTLLFRAQEGEAAAVPAIRHILVPLDRSEYSEAILEPVADLALLTHAHLTLLHVVEPILPVVEPAVPYPVGVDRELTQRLTAEAQRHLDEVADRLRTRGFSVATRVVVGAGAAATVLEQAQAEGADLIAMTTHGAKGVRRLLLGSVTDKVVRGSDRPVLVRMPAGVS